MCISVLCLFVDKKLLQNETSQISTDLIQNLKIKIISISVLNLYFFENFHFHIESNLIDIKLISNQILSFFVSNFPSHPSLVRIIMLAYYTREIILLGIFSQHRDFMNVLNKLKCLIF
jgi:hypothetical protein